MRPANPIAKVTRPEPSGYFPRHRLYRLLDKARNAPVLWVSGPPGCGKTALLSSYLESRHLPCLWYKIDEGDADLATFFYYLGLAAAKAAPRKKKRLPFLTPERLPGLNVFAQRYFEDLSSMLPNPCLLVLDDCHRLHDDSPFFEMLSEGISRLAPRIGAVLISRADPHPAFARERANRQLEVFGWSDLRLTLEEAAGIVRLQRKGRTPPGLVRDLFERTDGWAAGLVLLLERKDRDQVEPRTVGRHVPAEIIDYFGSEIFRRLDEQRRTFLIRSAILPRMTASMAERLTGESRAGPILSEMYRMNRFTKMYPQREPVYEYHDLFREFLLEKARDDMFSQDLAETRKAAAVLLEETGYIEDAAALFRQVGDWPELARLILSQARSLVSQARCQTLLEWLGALPNEVLEDEPWLLYWSGACLLQVSPVEGLARFEAALPKFQERGEAAGVYLCWAGAVESILGGMGSLSPLHRWISLFPSLLERGQDFPTEEIGDEVTCTLFSALAYHGPLGIDVELWADRTRAVARKTPHARLKIKAGLSFLVYKLGKGGFQESERLLPSLREVLKRQDVSPFHRIWVKWMEAALSVFLSRHERCLRVVSEGLALAESTGVHLLDPLLVGYGALSALHLGDGQTASRYLGWMAEALGRMTPPISCFYHGVFLDEALARRDLRQAASHVDEYLRLYDESGYIPWGPIVHLKVAHVRHALQEDEAAVRHLAQARRIGSEIDSPHAFWLSALTEAYFRLERGEGASAVAVLRQGLQIGREHGLFGTFVFVPGFLEKVSGEAILEEIEVDYVKELIRRNRLVPDPANPELEQWPWPVKVRTLGRFELLVEGRPVEFGRKIQQRPLSLLKALIALGGRGVPEARLAELLWPDADGDLAHQSFTAALSRLRKLLGNDEALVLKEGRLSLSRRHCWVDAWAFESLLRHADKVTGEGKRDEEVRLLGKALPLYQGLFLPFEEMSWAASPREKWRADFLRAVTQLGRWHEEAERWEAAVSCYEKGLGADGLAEELYRRLMICHLRRGRMLDALSVYRRCRTTLSSVLGVEPSPETQAIAASIKRSGS